MECALVVYLRDPSFEVHGSLPHRHMRTVFPFNQYEMITSFSPPLQKSRISRAARELMTIQRRVT